MLTSGNGGGGGVGVRGGAEGFGPAIVRGTKKFDCIFTFT